MTPRASLIITTYNRPDALAAVLRGVARQSVPPHEVLVADDGSAAPTGELVAAWRARLPFPLRHIWQEDRGFRAGEARNRALSAASGDYVIFLDGDCVPAADFVARHVSLAAPGFFVAGNRVLLMPAFTEKTLRASLAVETLPFMQLALLRLKGGINRLLPALRLDDGAWRLRNQHWEGVRTCNFAAWRRDLLRVDGFDCAFEGWGLEDSDLAIRLLNAGVKRKDGRFATGVFHLWHREADRAGLARNRRLLETVLTEKRITARKGLSTLVSAANAGEGA